MGRISLQTGSLSAWVLTLGLATATQGYAYHLDDHRQITRIAQLEVRHCFEESFTDVEARSMSEANVFEDVNLLRKWVKFSHFYSPTHDLDMLWRVDSMARIDFLVPKIRRAIERLGPKHQDVASFMGRLIHHLQDVTVPAHVVPVMHGADDGFESHELKAFPEPRLRTASECETAYAEARLGTPQEFLRETALATLASVNTTLVPHLRNGTPSIDSAGSFWVEPVSSGFGQYGVFGNHFGEPSFSNGNVTVQIEPGFYETFRATQFRLAIDATRKALLWLIGERGLLQSKAL